MKNFIERIKCFLSSHNFPGSPLLIKKIITETYTYKQQCADCKKYITGNIKWHREEKV